MPLEIERKFLLRNDTWRGDWRAERFCQGYLTRSDSTTVRVRRIGGRAVLTIKGAAQGAVRHEYEYEIPLGHAQEMLAGLCRAPLVEKIRHHVAHGGRLWHVDEFVGANCGLVLAEIELPHPRAPIDRPGWLGDEVTGDPRYRNSFLARHPFATWRDAA
jgi:adenylate cyclase